MPSVSTVSDLHIFSRRSQADLHMDAIHDALDNSDRFVLNGDTFDFRWTTLDTIEETVDAAIEWLDKFASRAPHSDVHFVLGNHDHNQAFMDALETFAETTPNFSWHPYYVKFGDTLFMHGDPANKKMSAADLQRYREGWLHDRKKGEMLNKVYDVAFRYGAHKRVSRVAFPKKKVLDRLIHYLDDIGHGPDSDTETVYFGHTHLALSDHIHKGLRFRNGGAPMPGLEFNILNGIVDY